MSLDASNRLRPLGSKFSCPAAGQRAAPPQPAMVKDDAMLAEFDRCRQEGTPRPESQAVRARVPAVFWSFAKRWRDAFKNGAHPQVVE
jgi:hypothetical protein